MIIIPNMSKPKSCYNHCLEGFIANKEIGCPLKDYTESHQYKSTIPTTCPLIEIVRCEECKYRYMDKSVWLCLYGLMIKPNGFCNYGERRADE